MAQIDAKWIQYDSEKLTTIVKDVNGVATNFLTIRDDVVHGDVGCENINEDGVELRFVSEGAPVEDPERDMSRDIWIQVPDQV